MTIRVKVGLAESPTDMKCCSNDSQEIRSVQASGGDSDGDGDGDDGDSDGYGGDGDGGDDDGDGGSNGVLLLQ